MLGLNRVRLLMAAALMAVMVVVGGFYWHGWWEEVSAQAVDASLSDIDRFVSEKMADEKIPGMAVVVVQGEQVTYLKGFGTTSLHNPSSVTPQTVFDLASCSKSFTALAVLLLQEDGLVDLDLPVSNYLPDFKTVDPEISKEITIRHLLNHSSGLPGAFSEPLAFQSGVNAMEKLVVSLDRVHLNRAPGSSFEYSNLNYSLLGALIDKVSGMSFEEYLKQRVFIPLGMTHTTMLPGEADEMDRADGHQLLFGRVITRNIPIYRSIVPAGWVMSSAEDMGKWLTIHLTGGRIDEEQIIPPQVIEETHTPGVSYEQNGKEVGYGMGWLVGLSDTGLLVIWHGGDTSNFAADMILLPEHQLGVAVLVNSQNSSELHSFAPDVVGLVLGQELEPPGAPWWASWRSVDTIAIAGMALSLAAILALGFYLWWRWRLFRRRRIVYLVIVRRKTLKVWWLVLPFTPLVLLMMALASIPIIVWLMFGFNLSQTLIRFGSFSPPGAWIAWWTTFATLCLWAFTLAGQTVFHLWLRYRVMKRRSPS